MRDLHILPKVRDSLSFLYVEHARIEQDAKAIAIYDAEGKTPVPCAALTTLILGPGTNISHAAIRTLAEAGCLVVWAGEQGVRFYAQGLGETRSSRMLLRQIQLWADLASRHGVIRRMYEMRFLEELPPDLTLQQIRGREGLRVRQTYENYSRATGVAWSGRSYDRTDWSKSDPINRALSSANAALYGVCHSAILSVGCSPAVGFIHTGRQLSFVYDIADLYKTEISIPSAFAAVVADIEGVERKARLIVRDVVLEKQLLRRIVPDLKLLLEAEVLELPATPDASDVPPGEIWDEQRDLEGGINWAES